MRRTTVACVLAVGLVACSGGDDQAEELPGNYGEIIASETECDQLQGIFDTAEGSDMDGRADVMAAADERMQEVGCYDE